MNLKTVILQGRHTSAKWFQPKVMSKAFPILNRAVLGGAVAWLLGSQMMGAQPFVHPGGLHTASDLERMRTNVQAGKHPWIDDWQRLQRDPQAQSTWKPAAQANLGASRQRADADAHAAYLNTLRWCICGDTNYAECAVRICNAWSAAVNQVPHGADIPGLGGIPMFDFALAGELLRTYAGWKAEDFQRYTNMMVCYYYPQCHGFLSNHSGRCSSYFWANWDACNIGALLAMGVLCDNRAIFNEGVEYFEHGAGMGSISNAVPFLYSRNFGQWQESGRDQEHAQLGVGLLGSACQVAWNQGVDLFGYADNRLLAGAEYVAKCNLSYPASSIPYTFYDNCAEARQYALSINGLGRLDRPVWELIYNHYVVLRGLVAPYSTALAGLMRPEGGSGDHFGYGTLAFTLRAAASPYPATPIPPAPAGLRAEAGISQIRLEWDKCDVDSAQGYIVRRASSAQGPFVTIAAWNNSSAAHYTDAQVADGQTYYYVVAATNQAGAGENSSLASARAATAGPLPAEWTNYDIGEVGQAGSAKFAPAGENTFVASGAGGTVGGKADAFSFTHRPATGDFAFSARLISADWTGRDKVGLMARESLAPGAKAVALTLGEVGNRQCRFGARRENSTAMETQAGCDYTWLPVWFKLQRVGSVVTGYQSLDGKNWFQVGSSAVSLPEKCLVGLAVAGGKKGALNTSAFDHVMLQNTAK